MVIAVMALLLTVECFVEAPPRSGATHPQIRAQAGTRHARENAVSARSVSSEPPERIRGRRRGSGEHLPGPRRDALARRSAGRAVRRLGHALVGHDADDRAARPTSPTTLERADGSTRHRDAAAAGRSNRSATGRRRRTERGAADRVLRRPSVLRHRQPVGARPRGPSHRRRDRGDGHARRRPRGRARPGPRRHRRRAVRRRVRLRARRRPGAGLHRRVEGPLRAADAAAPPAAVPRPARVATGSQAADRGRADRPGRRRRDGRRPWHGLFITVDPAMFAQTMELPPPPSD